jgi:uncharacterized membrane protein YwaF
MVPGILVLLVTMLTFIGYEYCTRKRNRDIGTNKCYLKKTPVHHREISVLGIGSNAVKCWTANCQTGV